MEKIMKFGKYLGYLAIIVVGFAIIGALTGPSEPKSYVDVTAYEIVSEMVDGVQPASKNEKLMNYLKKNKGVRISGYVVGVRIDDNTAVVSIAPFLQYDLTDDKQVRMAQYVVALEPANKDVDSAMRNLRRGDFVYADSTYMGFDDEGHIHFTTFKVDRQKAGIK